MPLAVSALVLVVLLSPARDTAAARTPAPADTTASGRRVVRQFPVLVVRAPVHDMRSSQTVRMASAAAMRMLPVDDLADAIALQAGVVAQGEELHVRGGRDGETTTYLDGLRLNEPRRGRALDVPVLALRSADLVSGAPEAQYGAGLAGTLDLRTVDPGEAFSGQGRWQSAGRSGTYDRASAMIGVPLHWLGLGVVAAGDATLDDGGLPDLRSEERERVAGLSLGWRAENRLLGYAKLASTDRSQRFVAQVLVNRRLYRPYDPAWSLDGWVGTLSDTLPGLPGEEPSVVTGPPVFSATEKPGYMRYRAADHLAVTDERQMAALVSVSASGPSSRGTLGLGWLRTRTVTSVSGGRGDTYVHGNTVFYSDSGWLSGDTDDPYHVIQGDYPLYRESGSDVFTLRADGETTRPGGSTIKAGAGATLERVTLYELDGRAFGRHLDSLRTYDASAPGAFAYLQGRASFQGLVVNAGLRAEYFTAGAQGRNQTLPWDGRGVWSLSPRIGIAYPVSVRDVFSLAYLRVQQDPPRDCLYDRRQVIDSRQPLGNPALVPATLISYEAAVKHLFGPTWALQGAVFFRDTWGQVGAGNHYYGYEDRLVAQCYTNDDKAQAAGCEWSLLYATAAGRRLEAQYTWMQAWGNESRPEGDPYGPVRGASIAEVSDVPLSWDRRHTIVTSGAWPIGRGLSLSWSTVVGSPLPWTPRQRRQYFTDLGLVNSRRLRWTETTNLDARWTPGRAPWLTVGLEVRNLFDDRGVRAVTVDGYPNPVVNTRYDDYGAYRTETGNDGGAYWLESRGVWVPVGDARLYDPPRSVRMSVGVAW